MARCENRRNSCGYSLAIASCLSSAEVKDMKDIEKPTEIPAECVMRLRYVTGMGVVEAREFLQSASPLFYSRVVNAINAQEADAYLHDPIEDEPAIQAIIKEAEEKTALLLEHEQKGMGYCHLFWNAKQRVLEVGTVAEFLGTDTGRNESGL